jgi:hypothetical protein
VFGILDSLKIFCPALCATEIVGLPSYNLFDPVSFGKVSFTKRVFDHHIIDHGQSLLLWSLCGRLPRKRPVLEQPIGKINQEEKN